MFPVQFVLLPVLTKMGAGSNLSLSILKYGFFPDIIGKVEVNVPALERTL